MEDIGTKELVFFNAESIQVSWQPRQKEMHNKHIHSEASISFHNKLLMYHRHCPHHRMQTCLTLYAKENTYKII